MTSKRDIAAAMLVRSGTSSLFRRTIRWSGVLTLNYHRIGDGKASLFDRGLWSATEEEFEDQLRYVKAHFDVISPRDLPDVRKRNRGRHAIITFDDGYRDNFTAGFAILQRLGIPATFFISTGFIDSPSIPWWDQIAWAVRTSPHSQVQLPKYFSEAVVFDQPDRERAVRTLLRAYKNMPAESTGAYVAAIVESAAARPIDPAAARELWMTWDMLRTMHAAGMTIGGHTVSHPILAQLSEAAQDREISGCCARIAAELGAPVTCLSYPVGGPQNFNDATRRCVGRAGISHAFSYYGGIQRFDQWDDFDIRRLPVDHDTTPSSFRAMVSMPQIFGRAEL